jgi:hypothetical protein
VITSVVRLDDVPVSERFDFWWQAREGRPIRDN